MTREKVLLEVSGLRKSFPVRKGLLQRVVAEVKAVDGVDFTVHEGETIGLVGESGCGKTTTGRAILQLTRLTAGSVRFRTAALSGGDEEMVDVARISGADLKRLRRDMQIIFQDPYSSLDPRMSVGDLIAEPLMVQNIGDKAERQARVVTLLEAVGLKEEHRSRYPHEFSGGQRQRIGIARALALNPRLVVADEPVSALDVSVQAQVINLLQDLQERFGLTYIFIAHDLSVVRHISDRVAVMYLGKVVEFADTADLYATPKHPYTEALLSAVPIADPDARRERIRLEGDVPSPISPPSGCPFHPRCPYAVAQCAHEAPPLRTVGTNHRARCHRVEDLHLRGTDA